MPKKPSTEAKPRATRKPKVVEEPKVEVFMQCLRCGGKKHEPTNDCDANG